MVLTQFHEKYCCKKGIMKFLNIAALKNRSKQSEYGSSISLFMQGLSRNCEQHAGMNSP